MALIKVDDTNFQKISAFPNVSAEQIQDTDLITGLHNGGNANFRIFDIVSKVMAGIDINPGEDPGYNPGELGEQVTYSVIINHSLSDPRRMCSYADDAIVFKGRNGWDNVKDKPIFKKIKNCILKNGVVECYLDPDDLTKKEDGTALSLGNSGVYDVMVEFPERLGYRFTWLDEDRLRVSVTNRPNAPGFIYDAFSYIDYNDCDKIYIGAFKAQGSGTLYSRLLNSTQMSSPTGGLTFPIAQQRTRNKGEGYEMRWYGSVVLIQALYLITYCTLNSSSALGEGFTSSSGYGRVGRNYMSGFCGGGGKFLGIEDLWGNIWEWVEGIQTDNSGNLLLYDFETHSWKSYGSVGSKHENQYISRVRGDRTGFIASEVLGSSTTKYCDISTLKTSHTVCVYGGSAGYKDRMGVFCIHLSDTETDSYTNVGSRLMYFHVG